MGLYYLKNKDISIALIEFSDDGQIINYDHNFFHPELAPVHDENNHDWLQQWWKRRAVPVNQNGINRILERSGLVDSGMYIIKNLGLSLTDCYWIEPIDYNLKWADISLFANDFHDNILLLQNRTNSDELSEYTPNSTLQGTLEKSWTIINGKRGLIKGNSSNLSSESINEVIAAKMHEMQNFRNHAEYKLIKINGRDYDYGCYTPIFTSENLEFISAYDVVCSEKKRNDCSYYEHFISVCGKHGMNQDELREQLDYMILSNFILSNRDMHLGNIGILRDNSTLKFSHPAPIYDNGKSLFVQDIVPMNDNGLLSIKTQSFSSDELGLLKLVSDRGLIDITKLPPRSFIEEMYALDTQIESRRITAIGEAYERKIELFRLYQLGRDLNIIKFAVRDTRNSNINIDDYIIKPNMPESETISALKRKKLR